MLMITGTDKKQSKIIVNTNQAFQVQNVTHYHINHRKAKKEKHVSCFCSQVSNLIREYMERVADRGVAPD